MARKPTYNADNARVVRDKILDDIEEVLKETKKAEAFGAFKKQMLLKLAPTVLPRVNEHTGEGGEPIKFKITGMKIIEK